jgi:hypothetical protein
MTQRKYWPLDYDPDGEIYDNLSWDLPGFRRNRRTARRTSKVPRSARKSD